MPKRFLKVKNDREALNALNRLQAAKQVIANESMGTINDFDNENQVADILPQLLSQANTGPDISKPPRGVPKTVVQQAERLAKRLKSHGATSAYESNKLLDKLSMQQALMQQKLDNYAVNLIPPRKSNHSPSAVKYIANTEHYGRDPDFNFFTNTSRTSGPEFIGSGIGGEPYYTNPPEYGGEDYYDVGTGLTAEGPYFELAHEPFHDGSGLDPQTLPPYYDGQGVKFFKNYKVLPTATGAGLFGGVMIDLPKLHMAHRLEVYKGNKKVISQKTDGDFIDLIHKRFDPKRQYSDKARDHFKKLVYHSGLPLFKNSKKAHLLTEVEVKTYSSPDELIHRLNYLKDLPRNKSNRNEVCEILDQLLNHGAIDGDQHKKIYDNYNK